ncbi:Self-incompatibility protein [Parasponia andersonii]|uniref:S-protein homolog n=1 Tax=Parasponia andersonii TaxID=3476 RepID=A0A2P5AUZ4_PARAD|nr:Self-incompatibility protein [Parasponia andersonii]
MKIKRQVMSFTIILFLAVLIIFMSFSQRGSQYLVSSGAEYDVRVINGFSDNSSLPLVIWCASEQSDLGGRALQEKDDFSWRLRTDLWGNPHFVCTMKWDQRRKSFDAFKVSRDVRRCSPLRKCSWLVTENGFFFSNDEVNWKKDFSWS